MSTKQEILDEVSIHIDYIIQDKLFTKEEVLRYCDCTVTDLIANHMRENIKDWEDYKPREFIKYLSDWIIKSSEDISYWKILDKMWMLG